jgi:hypothetical protein
VTCKVNSRLFRRAPIFPPVGLPRDSTSVLSCPCRLWPVLQSGLHPNHFLGVLASIAHIVFDKRSRSWWGSAFRGWHSKPYSWSVLSRELHHPALTMAHFEHAGKSVLEAAHAAHETGGGAADVVVVVDVVDDDDDDVVVVVVVVVERGKGTAGAVDGLELVAADS